MLGGVLAAQVQFLEAFPIVGFPQTRGKMFSHH